MREHIAGDLLRQHALLHEGQAPRSRVRLWLGMFSPRYLPVLLCRLAHWFHCLGLGGVGKAISLMNFFFFGIEIAVRCPIGKGLFLPHTQGTVIGAWSVGENATIFQQVTLGARELDFSYAESSRPVLEDGVTIGAGAKVLGPVVVGHGTRVGANSVVLHSLPANSVAVGAPARVVRTEAP